MSDTENRLPDCLNRAITHCGEYAIGYVGVIAIIGMVVGLVISLFQYL